MGSSLLKFPAYAVCCLTSRKAGVRTQHVRVSGGLQRPWGGRCGQGNATGPAGVLQGHITPVQHAAPVLLVGELVSSSSIQPCRDLQAAYVISGHRLYQIIAALLAC
jgi:hypothetical protein